RPHRRRPSRRTTGPGLRLRGHRSWITYLCDQLSEGRQVVSQGATAAPRGDDPGARSPALERLVGLDEARLVEYGQVAAQVPVGHAEDVPQVSEVDLLGFRQHCQDPQPHALVYDLVELGGGVGRRSLGHGFIPHAVAAVPTAKTAARPL